MVFIEGSVYCRMGYFDKIVVLILGAREDVVERLLEVLGRYRVWKGEGLRWEAVYRVSFYGVLDFF